MNDDILKSNDNSIKESSSDKNIISDQTNEKPLSKKTVNGGNPFKQMSSFFSETQTRKTYTLLTITFGFICVLVFTAILPTLISITQIVKKIDEYKVIRSVQQQKVTAITNLGNQSDNILSQGGINEYISFLDETYIPNKDQTFLIYKDLFEKAATNGVTLESMKTDDLSSAAENITYRAYTISIKSDNLANMQKMIANVGKSKYIYKVDKVSLTIPNISSSTTSDTSYSSNITFWSFFYV